MSGRWRVDVGRVVVTGAPRGLDAVELRALVGSAIGDRLRTAEVPPIRRVTPTLRVDAGRMAGGAPAVADRVAGAIVGSMGGRGRG
ncbi:MAG: hypothetical protein L0221_09080 [Chloroflexi bacterium]|nr:hypothetical protein [Chloroflexota bacterium]